MSKPSPHAIRKNPALYNQVHYKLDKTVMNTQSQNEVLQRLLQMYHCYELQ